jgi:hypothetical protein
MSTETRSAVVNSPRPYIESMIFIAVWVACGLLLRLGPDAYQVLGVPLLAFFQLVIRRRPLQELWIRDPEQPFRLDRLGLLLALAFMVAPGYVLFTLALPQRLWSAALALLCYMAGGFVAGFVLRNQRAEAMRSALPSFGAALLIGFAFEAIEPISAGRSAAVALDKVPAMLKDFLLYFAASFVFEEVVFRGALDPHVYPPGHVSSRTRAWGSALFVSVLWAFWHLPVAGLLNVEGLAGIVAILLFVHVLEGIPLSFCWRQGGTLVLPAAAHALLDAYRNALLLFP